MRSSYCLDKCTKIDLYFTQSEGHLPGHPSQHIARRGPGCNVEDLTTWHPPKANARCSITSRYTFTSGKVKGSSTKYAYKDLKMSKNKNQTSANVASLAAQKLRSDYASGIQQTLAGAVLAQARTGKQTSPEVAALAARALNNPRSADDTLTLAGSALSQTKG